MGRKLRPSDFERPEGTPLEGYNREERRKLKRWYRKLEAEETRALHEGRKIPDRPDDIEEILRQLDGE